MPCLRNNAKRQEYEANSTLIIITRKVETKTAGFPMKSQAMLAKVCVNALYKEQRKEAGI